MMDQLESQWLGWNLMVIKVGVIRFKVKINFDMLFNGLKKPVNQAVAK